VPIATLRNIGERMCVHPEGLNVHRKIDRFLNARRKTIEAGADIDWATAEALAFGSLLCEDLQRQICPLTCKKRYFSSHFLPPQ